MGSTVPDPIIVTLDGKYESKGPRYPHVEGIGRGQDRIVVVNPFQKSKDTNDSVQDFPGLDAKDFSVKVFGHRRLGFRSLKHTNVRT